MTHITPTQQDLLLAAAGAEGGAIESPPTKKPVADLIKRGLFISVPQDGGPGRLLITEAGRAAIGSLADQPAALEPPPAPATPSPPPPPAPSRSGKIGVLVALLRRPEGASVEAMMQATGWQAHSVRGALSGAIKKGLGLSIASEKTEAGRIYRIQDEAGAGDAR